MANIDRDQETGQRMAEFATGVYAITLTVCA